MNDLDAIRARAANIASGSVYSQPQTADDYQALLAEIDRRTTDLIAEQSVRQEEWDHASELLKDGVKSVSHWERETVAARGERDRYRLAWLSARGRAARLADSVEEATQGMAGDLYRAEDRLAFVREMCDQADREQRQITTEQVRAWTQYTGCDGAIVLPEADQAVLQEQINADRAGDAVNVPPIPLAIADLSGYAGVSDRLPDGACPDWCPCHRLRAASEEQLKVCPTLCDADCGEGCHEAHQPRHKRDHEPDDCPGYTPPRWPFWGPRPSWMGKPLPSMAETAQRALDDLAERGIRLVVPGYDTPPAPTWPYGVPRGDWVTIFEGEL